MRGYQMLEHCLVFYKLIPQATLSDNPTYFVSDYVTMLFLDFTAVYIYGQMETIPVLFAEWKYSTSVLVVFC